MVWMVLNICKSSCDRLTLCFDHCTDRINGKLNCFSWAFQWSAWITETRRFIKQDSVQHGNVTVYFYLLLLTSLSTTNTYLKSYSLHIKIQETYGRNSKNALPKYRIFWFCFLLSYLTFNNKNQYMAQFKV